MSKWTIILLVEIAVITVLNVMASGTPLLLVVPYLAAFGGWQLGVLTQMDEDGDA